MPVNLNFRLPDVSLLSMMGELQADAMGVSAIYDANMPVSYFEQSMSRFNNFLTQSGSGIAQNGLPFAPQGQQRQIPEWRVENTIDPTKCTVDANGIYCPGVTNPPTRGGARQLPASNGSGDDDPNPCEWYDVGCNFGRYVAREVIGEDFSKRILLFILAVLLIAAAVFSLR